MRVLCDLGTVFLGGAAQIGLHCLIAAAALLPKLEALVSGDEICRRFGFSRQTLRRLVRDKLFPEPVRLSKVRLAWRLREVDAWVENGGLKKKR